jgi:hypothetical protein
LPQNIPNQVKSLPKRVFRHRPGRHPWVACAGVWRYRGCGTPLVRIGSCLGSTYVVYTLCMVHRSLCVKSGLYARKTQSHLNGPHLLGPFLEIFEIFLIQVAQKNRLFRGFPKMKSRKANHSFFGCYSLKYSTFRPSKPIFKGLTVWG